MEHLIKKPQMNYQTKNKKDENIQRDHSIRQTRTG